MYNQFEVPAVRKEGASLSFRMEDYVQYLVDLQAQHHAVEAGVAEALAFHKGGSKHHDGLPLLCMQSQGTSILQVYRDRRPGFHHQSSRFGHHMQISAGKHLHSRLEAGVDDAQQL